MLSHDLTKGKNSLITPNSNLQIHAIMRLVAKRAHFNLIDYISIFIQLLHCFIFHSQI